MYQSALDRTARFSTYMQARNLRSSGWAIAKSQSVPNCTVLKSPLSCNDRMKLRDLALEQVSSLSYVWCRIGERFVLHSGGLRAEPHGARTLAPPSL